MDWHITLDRHIKIPLYSQIAEQIIAEINSGALKPGQRLPAERKMASLIGVNRSTVINAYKELEERGYVFSHVGRGTIVAEPANENKAGSFRWQELLSGQGDTLINPYNSTMSQLLGQRSAIQMDSGIANPEIFPREEFAEICQEILLTEGAEILQHCSPHGLKSLRESISSLMLLREIQASPEDVVIFNGSEQGIDIISRILLEPGDSVVLEEPSFLGAIDIFRAYGVRLIGIPVDREGMVVDHLEKVLARVRPKLIYTMPTFQNPSGACMNLSRRKRLLELANKYQIPILEDDPYGLIYFKNPPLPPLKSMDASGIVVYIGTFSKIVAPGLRLGWGIIPPGLIRLVIAAKQLTDLHNNTLIQRMMDLYYRKGLLEKHLTEIRQNYAKKQDAMLKAFQKYAPTGVSWVVPEGGFYAWVTLPENISSLKLLEAAMKNQVSFVAGPAFYISGEGFNKLRLNFTFASSEKVYQGTEILCRLIKDLKSRAAEVKQETPHELFPIV